MRVLLLNPPHIAIGSRIPREQLPPLGLLSIGGPLIDAGHDVALLDAELGPLSHDEVVERVVAHRPQVLLIGHSGSTSAHTDRRRADAAHPRGIAQRHHRLRRRVSDLPLSRNPRKPNRRST